MRWRLKKHFNSIILSFHYLSDSSSHTHSRWWTPASFLTRRKLFSLLSSFKSAVGHFAHKRIPGVRQWGKQGAVGWLIQLENSSEVACYVWSLRSHETNRSCFCCCNAAGGFILWLLEMRCRIPEVKIKKKERETFFFSCSFLFEILSVDCVKNVVSNKISFVTKVCASS